MATNLTYTISAYVPFTKILSSNINQDKTDIQNRLNWDGTTNTTGLGDSNIQSNTVSGGGITRNTKLKSGNANYVVINDSSGNMTEEVQLNISRGGTGLNIVPANQSAGDVIQVNSTLTGLTVGAPTAVAASLRIFQFNNFI